MKNTPNRFLSVAVILLLLANIALVAVMVLRKDKKQSASGRESGKAAYEKLVKDMGLTDTQKKQYDSLREAHFANVRPLFDSARQAKSALFNLRKEESLNDSIITVYTQRIASFQTQADRMALIHFYNVRKLFNAEQQKMYDEFVQKMMQRPKKDSTKVKQDK